MKFNLTGISKKTAGIALSSALIMGGLGTIAALAANNNDAVQKDTVVSVPVTAAIEKTAAANQGTIQYSKSVYSRADGSQNDTHECWYNPETKEWRADIMEYDTNHKLIRYQSSYLVNGSNDWITIQRDANGKAVSGTILKSAHTTAAEKIKNAPNDFNSIKEYFKGDSWTSDGTDQTIDGKTLNKVMKSYQSYINDTTQANMQLVEYLDKETGLPVKDELYEDSTGQYKLFSSDINEYKYVNDDGTLFNTDGVTLTEVQEQEK